MSSSFGASVISTHVWTIPHPDHEENCFLTGSAPSPRPHVAVFSTQDSTVLSGGGGLQAGSSESYFTAHIYHLFLIRYTYVYDTGYARGAGGQ